MYDVPGYKVQFRHHRYYCDLDVLVEEHKRGIMSASIINSYVDDFLSDFYQHKHPSQHGGMTVCYIVDPITDTVIADGIATCSWRDTFNRKIGRDISFGRAWERLQEMIERNDTSVGGLD